MHYGFCLEHVDRLEEGVARYREAIAQEPDFLEAHVDLAGALWRLEDFEGALAHAQKAAEAGRITRTPSSPGTALLT